MGAIWGRRLLDCLTTLRYRSIKQGKWRGTYKHSRDEKGRFLPKGVGERVAKKGGGTLSSRENLPIFTMAMDFGVHHPHLPPSRPGAGLPLRLPLSRPQPQVPALHPIDFPAPGAKPGIKGGPPPASVCSSRTKFPKSIEGERADTPRLIGPGLNISQVKSGWLDVLPGLKNRLGLPDPYLTLAQPLAR
jgi:hypothetical protein